MASRQKLSESSGESLDSLLGYNLRRLSVVTMAEFAKALKPLGLKPAAASVLFIVGANEGITQSDAGKALGILRANMTPLVAALMREGWIERKRLDGRSHALALSPEGRALCRRAWKVTQAHEDRLFGTITAAARARLIGQLRQIWANGGSVDG